MDRDKPGLVTNLRPADPKDAAQKFWPLLKDEISIKLKILTSRDTSRANAVPCYSVTTYNICNNI